MTRSWRAWTVAILAVAAAVAAVLIITSGDPSPSRSSSSATTPPAASAPKRSGAVRTTLHSRSDLRPPQIVVDHPDPAPDGRLMLITPRAGGEPARDVPGHQQGPMMLDAAGRTVWFAPRDHGQPATDLRVQRYQGKPVLTWWQGPTTKGGEGHGSAVIVDRSYRRIATVQAGHGYTMDLHEFRLTPRGTALVTIYSRARRDLSAIGGARDAQVTEGIVQEVDVATGRVLLEWHSLDHVDPSESVMDPPTTADASFDYFHVNSVDEDGHGHLLISARNTSTIYEVDRRTGAVIWRLGGKHSDFTIGLGAGFGLQHDARFRGADTISLFDNVAPSPGAGQMPSSGKILRLDERAKTATLVSRLDPPDGRWAESQGDTQLLGSGGAMIGWGSTGFFSRYDAAGALRFDAHLPEGYDSYRAYAQAWDATPATRPRVAANSAHRRLTVYASWNGATRLRAWQVLAGRAPDALRPVGRPAEWQGLETTVRVSGTARYVAVRALDASGRTLRTSAAVRVTPG